MRVLHDLGDIGGVAQSHIQALRADRRQHVGGFANQRDAMPGKLLGLLDRERKQMPSGLDTDAAEDRVRLRFRGFGQFVVAQRDQPLGFLRRRDPHHAAAVAGQRHENAGPLRGVKFGRDISMRPRMADVEGQRGLIESRGA